MTKAVVGFVGLGVMGEPMCANLLAKSGAHVRVFDLNEAPVSRLVRQGAKQASSAGALAGEVDVLFLSLPGVRNWRRWSTGRTALPQAHPRG